MEREAILLTFFLDKQGNSLRHVVVLDTLSSTGKVLVITVVVDFILSLSEWLFLPPGSTSCLD